MPTYRDDLGALPLSRIAWLASMKPQTARNRLDGKLEPLRKDGNRLIYETRPALRILLGGDSLNPQDRLAIAKAESQELQTAQDRGELVPGDATDRTVIALATMVSSRIQSLGQRTAPRLAAESEPARCQEIVDEAATEALLELSEAAEEAAGRLERAAA